MFRTVVRLRFSDPASSKNDGRDHPPPTRSPTASGPCRRGPSLGQLAWALGTLLYRNERLMAAVARRARDPRLLAGASPKDLAELMWGFAVLGVKDEVPPATEFSLEGLDLALDLDFELAAGVFWSLKSRFKF